MEGYRGRKWLMMTNVLLVNEGSYLEISISKFIDNPLHPFKVSRLVLYVMFFVVRSFLKKINNTNGETEMDKLCFYFKM